VSFTDPLGLSRLNPVRSQNISVFAGVRPTHPSGGSIPQTIRDIEPVEDGYDFSNGAVQVARADVEVWPRQGKGFNYRATDDQGSKPLQGTFNTGTSLNINQLPEGDYRVTPRPRVPEPGPIGKVRDFFMVDRNKNAGRPTISNTDNWNQVRFPDGSIHEGIQIHPGRQGTASGSSLGCLVCTEPEYNQLNQMFNRNYDNGGVFLHIRQQPAKP
jgi:hypothetical protein